MSRINFFYYITCHLSRKTVHLTNIKKGKYVQASGNKFVPAKEEAFCLLVSLFQSILLIIRIVRIHHSDCHSVYFEL